MPRVEFTRAAERDITDALAWYDEQAPGVGPRFLDEIHAISRRLAANPKQFPIVLNDLRSARLRRFPYRLIFLEADSTISVLAVFHMRRDPRRLEERQ